MPIPAEHIHVDDGKYTVVLRNDGSSTALRYGAPWPAFEGINQLDNLTVALARDLQSAREEIAHLKEETAS